MTVDGEPLNLDVAQPALLFELDGTVADSVYQDVIPGRPG
jgi:hypothetical protein